MALVDRLADVQPYVKEWAIYTCKLMQLQTGGRLEAGGKVVGGVSPTITSGYRSIEQQKQLRQLWEESGAKAYPVRYNGQMVYPANLPGDSAHNWGMGWDSDVPDAYMPLWRYVRSMVGWTLSQPAGRDDVHAEWPRWRELVRAAGHQL